MGRHAGDEQVELGARAERRARRRSTRSRRSRSGTTGRRGRASTRPPRPCSSPTPTPASSPRAMTSELTRRRGSSTAAGTPPTSARRRTSSAASSRSSRRSSRRSSPRAYERTDRDRQAARPAAAARARRVRQHRAAPRPRDARVDGRGPGHPARLGLPGHGADQRRLRTRPRPDDRLEPPRQGDPLRHRRPADARLRRRAARRRGGAPDFVDLEAPKGAARRPSRSAYRHLAPANVLREMRPGQGVLVYGHLAAGADRAAAVVQGSAVATRRKRGVTWCRPGGGLP